MKPMKYRQQQGRQREREDDPTTVAAPTWFPAWLPGPPRRQPPVRHCPCRKPNQTIRTQPQRFGSDVTFRSARRPPTLQAYRRDRQQQNDDQLNGPTGPRPDEWKGSGGGDGEQRTGQPRTQLARSGSSGVTQTIVAVGHQALPAGIALCGNLGRGKSTTSALRRKNFRNSAGMVQPNPLRRHPHAIAPRTISRQPRAPHSRA